MPRGAGSREAAMAQRLGNTFLASWRLGVSLLSVLLALSATVATQAPLEFDVASIKRNTTNTFASGPPPGPASGQVSIINAPVQTLVLQAYPLQTVPVQVLGLPAWAQSERYDVMAKTRPARCRTTRAARAGWRA